MRGGRIAAPLTVAVGALAAGGLALATVAVAALAVATFAVAALPGALSAQSCSLQVEPLPGETGYRNRGAYCEGMFIGLQSSPMNLQVISLVHGDIAIDGRSGAEVPILVAVDRLELRDVQVIGRSREANLNWAFDSQVLSESTLPWDLDVIQRVELESSQIGLFARGLDAAGEPVFAPVSLGGDGSLATTDGDSLHLVIHIPTAGDPEGCLRRLGGDTCHDLAMQEVTRGGFFDGFFEATLPPWEPGEVRELLVSWRPMGAINRSRGSNAGRSSRGHDRIRIVRW